MFAQDLVLTNLRMSMVLKFITTLIKSISVGEPFIEEVVNDVPTNSHLEIPLL